MAHDLERALTRELRDIADAVSVPTLPEIPRDPATRPAWPSLLAAAAALLVVLGTVATFVALGDDARIQPAPSPSPTEGTGEVGLTTEPPQVPYLLGNELFVGGEQVPGHWSRVRGTDEGWTADRGDGDWAGSGRSRRQELPRTQQPPAVSPDGSLVAWVDSASGRLLATEPAPSGRSFEGPPIDEIDENGVDTKVAAVTGQGYVVTRGEGTSVLWRALGDGTVVDLAETAPGQVVLGQSTDGLLVVVDGSEGASDTSTGDVYLAEVSGDGELDRRAWLPNADDLAVSGRWVAWAPPGSLDPQEFLVDGLHVQRIDGSSAGRIQPPEGWSFMTGRWTWESDEALVAAVVDRSGEDRMVRCLPTLERCVLTDLP